MSDFPDDIRDAAREALSALLALGLDITAEDHSKAIAIISQALLNEREGLQADVIAAVADESEECRSRVFRALRKAVRQ